LDVYELWIERLGVAESVLSWTVYLLIALIPYGLNNRRKGARTAYCAIFFISVVFIALFAFSPGAMSSLRWLAVGVCTALDVWILVLLFSPAASSWLNKEATSR